MRKVVLYIAMSLDGYLADVDGKVDWLVGDGSEPDNQGSYPEFIETVDTIIMGYTTYHQLVTELVPEGWVYPEKMTYVLTHKEMESKENIIFTQKEPFDLLEELFLEEGDSIWICGGSSIANQLIELDIIDEYCISIIPNLLGKGISLFQTFEKSRELELISTRNYNGIVDLVYRLRKKK